MFQLKLLTKDCEILHLGKTLEQSRVFLFTFVPDLREKEDVTD